MPDEKQPKSKQPKPLHADHRARMQARVQRDGLESLAEHEALEYLSKEGFCNPHQLVCDLRRVALRKSFFARYLAECEVYMVNTTCTAEETQENIRGVLGGRCGI